VTPGASNTVSVTFSPYQGGRIYQLQAAASISSQVWTTLTNQASTDTNGNGIFTVSESAGTNSFYRLSATLAP
jgi:hypothetical protein